MYALGAPAPPPDDFAEIIEAIRAGSTQWTIGQRAMLALRWWHGQRSPEVSERALITAAAEAFRLAERSIWYARLIQHHGGPEVVAATESGALSLTSAAAIAKLPAPDQVVAVDAALAAIAADRLPKPPRRRGKARTKPRDYRNITHRRPFIERIERTLGSMEIYLQGFVDHATSDGASEQWNPDWTRRASAARRDLGRLINIIRGYKGQ
jgi:hypothetical protein